MRAFIAIIATVTMVIHFTVGCCMHVHHQTTQACADPICSGHDHHTAHADEDAHEPSESEPSVLLSQHEHDCDGCRCVATRSAKVTLPIVSVLSSHVICDHLALLLGTSAAFQFAPDPFVYSGLRPHSIFERFLI